MAGPAAREHAVDLLDAPLEQPSPTARDRGIRLRGKGDTMTSPQTVTFETYGDMLTAVARSA